MIWKNKHLPCEGYTAMAVFPFIFVRKDYVDKATEKGYAKTLRHERIHFKQQLECLFLFFYIIYLIDYLRLRKKLKTHKLAYRNICFEREAYANAANENYERKLFAFLKYFRR